MNESLLSINGFLLGLVLVLLFFFAVFISVKLLGMLLGERRKPGVSGRNSLEQWSKTVKFSPAQLTAMRSIWHAYKADRISSETDPFRHLNPQDMADLLKKCSFDAIPAELRRDKELRDRQAFILELEERGLDPVQAEVITGMKFGKLGPASEP